MVTYLNCFIICDYYRNTLPIHGDKPFSIYFYPDRTDEAEYILPIGAGAMDYLADLLGAEYPLPKNGGSSTTKKQFRKTVKKVTYVNIT